MSHTRQRAEDTPSHPGGLSEEGRMLLEAHRRRRDHQRGAFASFHYSTLLLIRCRGYSSTSKESRPPARPR